MSCLDQPQQRRVPARLLTRSSTGLGRQGFARLLSVHQPPYSQRIFVLQFIRQRCAGKILETNKPREAINRPRANGGGAAVGSGGIRSTVDRGMTHFEARRIAVEDQPANFRFENRD